MRNLRLIIQILSFVVLLYGGRLGINKFFLKSENRQYIGNMLPAFSCPYVEGRAGGCYLMPLQRIFADTDLKEYAKTLGWPLIKSFFFFFFFYILLGRMWCGWVCPLGTIQDILSKIRSFSGINYLRFSRKTQHNLKSVKYAILILSIFVSFFIANSFFGLGKISPDFKLPFCQLCPAKPLLPLFEGNLKHITFFTLNNRTLLMTTLAMIILALFLAGSFFQRRFFCKFCPMLALMNVFGHLNLFQFRKNPKTCTHCENCAYVCPMDIRKVTEERKQSKILDEDCILCLSCIEACPEDKTLYFRFFRFSIFESLRKRVWEK